MLCIEPTDFVFGILFFKIKKGQLSCILLPPSQKLLLQKYKIMARSCFPPMQKNIFFRQTEN